MSHKDSLDQPPDYSQLLAEFNSRYGESAAPVRIFFAPGRVNLIGDHIDYHGGLVFPCAINPGTTLLTRQIPDKPGENQLQLASANFDFSASLEERHWEDKVDGQWINYPLGVLQQFRKGEHGDKISGGLQCLYSGNLPNSAGLSSSASVEVVTAFALNSLFGCGMDLPDLARLCQRAENEFVGVQCGIMDQFASAMGKRGHAMELSCADLQHKQVPLQLGDYQILLINSNQSRGLSDSKYNERVTETNKALSLLQAALPVTQLTDVTPDALDKHQTLFADFPLHFQRARHVVTEQARVLKAVEVLQAGDIEEFGRLMFQSHDSLDQDYAVSSDPLDLLVKLAREDGGVAGARLTGAGFGGCTVNLVHRGRLEAFCDHVASIYKAETGLEASFLVVEPADGVHEIKPDAGPNAGQQPT